MVRRVNPVRKAPDESRRNERARVAILTATAELFRTVGYDKMSIEGIATAAGAGKQTIYRWWPSKAAVVLDVWAPEVEPRVRFPDTGDLAADLKTQIRTIIDLAHDPLFGPSFLAVLADAQRDERVAQQLLDRLFYPAIAACKDRLRIGQKAGQLSADIDLDIAVDLLYGGYYHRLLLGIAPLTPDYADAIVNAALSGIGASPASRARRRGKAPRREKPSSSNISQKAR